MKALLEPGDGTSFETRFVKLGDLKRTSGSALFVEDRRSQRLLAQCKKLRNQWWKAKLREPDKSGSELAEAPAFQQVWLDLLISFPQLTPWSEAIVKSHGGLGWSAFTEMVLILFSLVNSAASGKEVNYRTGHKGPGMLTSMINSALENGKFKPYKSMISRFIRLRAVSELLRMESVERKLKPVHEDICQAGEEDPVWQAMTTLFPEVLNPIIRQKLSDFNALPPWAKD